MAVTVTLKTLQQQTFKIRMEPHETVSAARAGAARSAPRGWASPPAGLGRPRIPLPPVAGPGRRDRLPPSEAARGSCSLPG